MWNTPTEKELSKVPKLYETENVKPKDKKILFHFFISGTDWYISEYDQKDDLFFGFCILNNDYDNAEWGYISFKELQELRTGFVEVDRDLFWDVKKASEIKEMVKAGGV